MSDTKKPQDSFLSSSLKLFFSTPLSVAITIALGCFFLYTHDINFATRFGEALISVGVGGSAAISLVVYGISRYQYDNRGNDTSVQEPIIVLEQFWKKIFSTSVTTGLFFFVLFTAMGYCYDDLGALTKIAFGKLVQKSIIPLVALILLFVIGYHGILVMLGFRKPLGGDKKKH